MHALQSSGRVVKRPLDQPATLRFTTSPSIVRKRRLSLCGHVVRHNHPAAQVLLWEPEERRKVDRPSTALRKILKRDTDLSGNEILAVMHDRLLWQRISSHITAPRMFDDDDDDEINARFN